MKPTFTIHYLGSAHLPASLLYKSCAFTQKIVKLNKMLCDLGHEVYFYGCKTTQGPALEDYVNSDRFHFVETHTVEDIRADYSDGKPSAFEVGYDWQNGPFRFDFDPAAQKISTQKFVANSIAAINARKRQDDFLLMSLGTFHKTIHEATNLFLTCEPGVGYRGSYCRFRVFESMYLRSYMLGVESKGADWDGHVYDRVIPNYFDPADFEFSDAKDNYVLFIGRLIIRKGVMTAVAAAQAAGVRLKISGQGGRVNPDGSFVSLDDKNVTFPAGNWEYVGYSDVEQRKKLYSRARATLVPTVYSEPFGGVHVESMLSGTPVITSAHGCFGGEVYVDGVHGYKCDTLNDYAQAIKIADHLDKQAIRGWAEQYLMANVAPKYQRWFEDLYAVYLSSIGAGKGWAQVSIDRPRWHEQVYG